MPVVPFVSAEHLTDLLAVSLPRYAQIVDYSEAAFFGVQQPGQTQYQCRTIWTRWQRQAVTRALMNAQGEFWKHCGYPFVPTYITAERHPYKTIALLDNCNVVALGEKADVMVAAGETIDYTNDPATVACATTVTDPDEIHVFHPGTDYEIIPSSVVIAGGTVTILIPRVRMVALAYDDNPAEGWDYSDDTYFETEVDVRRIYLDTTHQVQVYCREDCTCPPGDMTTYWNNAYLRNARIGHIELDCDTSICDCNPRFMEASYLCGLEAIPIHAEDAIIRLAHSLMPEEPCGCDFLRAMWNRDKDVPDVLTAERENCPLGMSNGAWIAWCFMRDLVCYRGGTL